MPTVTVNRDVLYRKLGQTYTDEEFEQLGFQLGFEVEVVKDQDEENATNEDQMNAKNQGQKKPKKDLQLKIEVGANRYDLLCVEGIALVLNVYNGKMELPTFKIHRPLSKEQYRMIIKPNTEKVRPYVVGAILRGIVFNKEIYDSFIDLQDKLHQNIGRKRTLVAIGTHDLDKVVGPFTYDAQRPKDIKFVALSKTQVMSADKLMDEYSKDPNLKEYVPIIKDKSYYPVIRDRRGVVLSMPPIINGDHSKITLNTRNVLIECTGTDLFRTKVVLDTMVCMFSGYCAKPYTVEPMEIVCPNGKTKQYPELTYRTENITPNLCNMLAGTNESVEDIATYLNKMALSARAIPSRNEIAVEIGPLRYDVLHEVDIVNDFCTAYGYNKIKDEMKLPTISTIAHELELNYLSDKVRNEIALNGFTEAATLTLCSKSDITDKLRLKIENVNFVEIGNPKTIECQALRNTLLPGLMRTVASNKHMTLPIRMFEVADVVFQSEDPILTKGTGAFNQRHICAINYNKTSQLQLIHGLLDGLMKALKIPSFVDTGKGYQAVNKEYPFYHPAMSSVIMVDDEEVGHMGVLHPDVIMNFSLVHPGSSFSLNLQRLFELAKI